MSAYARRFGPAPIGSAPAPFFNQPAGHHSIIRSVLLINNNSSGLVTFYLGAGLPGNKLFQVNVGSQSAVQFVVGFVIAGGETLTAEGGLLTGIVCSLNYTEYDD